MLRPIVGRHLGHRSSRSSFAGRAGRRGPCEIFDAGPRERPRGRRSPVRKGVTCDPDSRLPSGRPCGTTRGARRRTVLLAPSLEASGAARRRRACSTGRRRKGPGAPGSSSKPLARKEFFVVAITLAPREARRESASAVSARRGATRDRHRRSGHAPRGYPPRRARPFRQARRCVRGRGLTARGRGPSTKAGATRGPRGNEAHHAELRAVTPRVGVGIARQGEGRAPQGIDQHQPAGTADPSGTSRAREIRASSAPGGLPHVLAEVAALLHVGGRPRRRREAMSVTEACALGASMGSRVCRRSQDFVTDVSALRLLAGLEVAGSKRTLPSDADRGGGFGSVRHGRLWLIQPIVPAGDAVARFVERR